MKFTIDRIGAFALVGFATVSQASILNGGFEDYDPGSADINGGFYFTYNAGNTGIQDWAVGLTSVDVVVGAGYAFAGSSCVDLVGTPGPGKVMQSVNMLAGQEYTLSFWGRYTNATLNDKVIVDVTNSSIGQQTFHVETNYRQYSVNFTATNTAAGIISLSSDPGNSGIGNTFIDEVTLDAVPEPASLVVLAGAGMIALRRKKSR